MFSAPLDNTESLLQGVPRLLCVVITALTIPVAGIESGRPPTQFPWHIPHRANNTGYYNKDRPWLLDVEDGELKPFVHGGGGADKTFSTWAGMGTPTNRQFLWTSARSHTVRTTEPVGCRPLGTAEYITPRYNFDIESPFN